MATGCRKGYYPTKVGETLFGGRRWRYPMRWLSAAVAIAAILAPALASDDAARGVVEKAIKAQGGADKVAKLRVMRIKAEGTTTLVPGQPAIPFVIDDWWQMLDQ